MAGKEWLAVAQSPFAGVALPARSAWFARLRAAVLPVLSLLFARAGSGQHGGFGLEIRRSREGRAGAQIENGQQRLGQHAGDENSYHRGHNHRQCQPGATDASPTAPGGIIKNWLFSYSQDLSEKFCGILEQRCSVRTGAPVQD